VKNSSYLDDSREISCSEIATSVLEQEDLTVSIDYNFNIKYLDRMDRKAVHNSIYDFKIRDEVYLKKDFDVAKLINV
jgi:hypothetical protein